MTPPIKVVFYIEKKDMPKLEELARWKTKESVSKSGPWSVEDVLAIYGSSGWRKEHDRIADLKQTTPA